MATSSHVPQIFDEWKRVARTAIQTGIPAFLTFATGVPALLAQAHVFVSPRLYAALLVLAGGITTVAAVLTWVMAQPWVNTFLAQVGLGGHSGTVTAVDSYTGFVKTITPAVPVTVDPSQVAAGPQPQSTHFAN